jgi:hypothetical protein
MSKASISIPNIDHAIIISSVNNNNDDDVEGIKDCFYQFRHYKVKNPLALAASAKDNDDIEKFLVEVGPRFDFHIARTYHDDKNVDMVSSKIVNRKTKENIDALKSKKKKNGIKLDAEGMARRRRLLAEKEVKKNLKTDALGQTKGRLHLGRQNLDKMHLPHEQARRKRLSTKNDNTL